jgi:orotidine-5'-phosphate decarboxylase
MFVVGATKVAQLQTIRSLIPDHFLLIPGVGTQGGNLDEVCVNALNKDAGILINVSRQIIYSSSGEDFASRAGEEAKRLQQQMAVYL